MHCIDGIHCSEATLAAASLTPIRKVRNVALARWPGERCPDHRRRSFCLSWEERHPPYSQVEVAEVRDDGWCVVVRKLSATEGQALIGKREHDPEILRAIGGQVYAIQFVNEEEPA